MTRIIAGRARGRRLAVPPSGTRPTSDRVREAMFSSLDSHGPHPEVLDLYAGSGALGLEALSRGARTAVLVEKDRRSAAVISANASAVGLPGATVVVSDVRQFLAGGRGARKPFDLVLIDPPYDVADAEVADVLQVLAEGWLASGALVVVERSARSPEPTWPAGFTARGKRYGETALWYGQYPDELTQEDP